jgi:hypothetical protein
MQYFVTSGSEGETFCGAPCRLDVRRRWERNSASGRRRQFVGLGLSQAGHSGLPISSTRASASESFAVQLRSFCAPSPGEDSRFREQYLHNSGRVDLATARLLTGIFEKLSIKKQCPHRLWLHYHNDVTACNHFGESKCTAYEYRLKAAISAQPFVRHGNVGTK